MTRSHRVALARSALLLAVASPAVTGPQDAPATFELVAAWGPVESDTYRVAARHPAVARAMNAGPATPRATFDARMLRPFLPREDARVGAVWEVAVDDALPFLALLHPGVSKEMRFEGPAVEGGRATLLRQDAEELAVLVRVHVEFELIPRDLQFLPAQFEGHLVWDRAADRPRSFHLALPPRDTNFDINYKNDVDIGYLPLMQVATEGARPAGPEAEPARQRMRESFYPSSRIRWRSLEEALARARENGRRLHVMQLFGTLDDESC